MLTAKSESLTFYFSIWIPFIYFSSLIAVAKTSRAMLNNTGKGGYICLVPDLRGNAFSFSPLRKMFAVGLSIYGFCYVEVSSIQSLCPVQLFVTL